MIISEKETREIIERGFDPAAYTDKRVLVLTPDATRTCPLPMLIRTLNQVIGQDCDRLDFMVALGTHTPMPKEKILELYGIDSEALTTDFAKSSFFNHRWDLPDTFTEIGMITREEVLEISDSRLDEEVPIVINRKIFEYDLILVLGPVFPHEVVGFSGGAKYLFPGIAGGEFLHFFHWLGAVMTCKEIIGEKDTPVRQLINKAMKFIPVPVQCLSLVVKPDKSLCGVFAGDIFQSWSKAADLSSQIHIQFREQTYHTVLGCSSVLYDEIWTAGKVMYKLEQMVAKGGTLIIYGPHIKEVSRTWGRQIKECGYHVRDYFLEQMDRFQHLPRGVLAHSTHVRGTGKFENGVEQPDVHVVLATGISKETCDTINLGYQNPAQLDLNQFQNREQEGILYVESAGEILYKLNKTA